MAIRPIFDAADPFSKGHAVVKLDGRFGIIDETGTVIAPTEYEGAGILPAGELLLYRGGISRLLDRTGKLIVEAQVQFIRPLDSDHVLLGDEIRYFDPTRFDLIESIRDGRWRIRTLSTGHETTAIVSEVSFIADEPGLAFWQKINDDYFLTTPDGHRLTGELSYGGYLQNGLIVASKNDRWGFIDPAGQTVIDFQFDWVSSFGGRNWTEFRVGPYDKAKFGFIDETGKIVIPAQFDHVLPFVDGFAEVTLDGVRMIIDRTGQRSEGCRDTVMARQEDAGFRLLRPDGSPLNDETYGYAQVTCGQPTLIMTKDGKSGFLDNQGELLSGRYYLRADPFYDGVAVIWEDETHVGIIDTTGNFIVTPVLARADFTSTGDYTVINPGPDHVIVTAEVARSLAKDPSLLTTAPPEPPDIFCPADGVDIVESDGTITHLDTTGGSLFEGAFDFATCFHRDDKAWVAVRDRREWCEINKKGWIDPQSCDCHQPVIIIEFGSSSRDEALVGLDC